VPVKKPPGAGGKEDAGADQAPTQQEESGVGEEGAAASAPEDMVRRSLPVVAHSRNVPMRV
jgi:hypothetical protein